MTNNADKQPGDNVKQAMPDKCSRCNKPMSDVLVCDFCHAINPAATMTDHFSLLGLPRQFELDEQELYRKFIALSRHAHPDFAAGEPLEVQQLHLKISASLNDAYATLKDPASRAAYLLELLGGRSSADDKSVPEGFLGTMMMMQEEIADARENGRRADLDRARGVLQTQQDGLLKRIAGLFRQHQEAMGCEAVRKDLLDEIRKQLNAVSYVRKLLSQL